MHHSNGQRIFIICLHLTQRFLTIKFLFGFATGIILTLIFNSRGINDLSDTKSFRPDQSKFEYEKNKNQKPNDDYLNSVNDNKQSLTGKWKYNWDGNLTTRGSSSRNLYLIRHGQYYDNAKQLSDMKLTPLGREQAVYTGKRLNEMKLKFNRLIHSGMVRARETAEIITENLQQTIELTEDKNLTEGLPIAPEPYAGISQKDVEVNELYLMYGDKSRIDHAFRTYFHRAMPSQSSDTHDIIVFHANLLRYFICKVMQFPAEAWLRITLNHGSITQITVLADGTVILKNIGDAGFIPVEKVTF
ncbi:unnamed protein product [Didymodactylos carnosus]|uniref:Serine/threonine-protein phosphatase PGAM5, mitochondrial n=1 Tax=Didymodactylos carnosus TaxID=1234261 RepID=A0A814QK27_9BILA|nr:unnamed protein product [Didymodactylos carnosus]CAF1120602.1 unnamed protein product [Didymodactylos carnosus]CAF3799471.1 unnamed protein product [Didymodactylos carnosus]CAF3884190.1 unnamed protein product [Didymodactylos carnosus]